MVVWVRLLTFITNGTSIVEIPVSVDENLDKVEKKLNKYLQQCVVNTTYSLSIQLF